MNKRTVNSLFTVLFFYSTRDAPRAGSGLRRAGVGAPYGIKVTSSQLRHSPTRRQFVKA